MYMISERTCIKGRFSAVFNMPFLHGMGPPPPVKPEE